MYFSWKPLPYFLERLSNEMQSTFHKALMNTIKKLLKKVATKLTFILLYSIQIFDIRNQLMLFHGVNSIFIIVHENRSCGDKEGR